MLLIEPSQYLTVHDRTSTSISTVQTMQVVLIMKYI